MQLSILPDASLRGAVFLFVSSLALLVSGGALMGQSNEGVGPYRTQVIELEAGWNAVYLEVQPLESAPTSLLEGTPVEIAAAFFRPVAPMEFIDSPSELLSKRENWSVWYAPDRDDALLSNLYALQAHQSYLIYIEEDYTWSVEGAPILGAASWHPNSYSLVGFQIDPSEQPTVENFFAGSDAQSTLQLYSLVDGRWALITQPESTLLEPGVAYWAYSEGASDYSGPVDVRLPANSAGGLIFSENSASRRIEIENVSSYPQNLTFEVTAGNAGLLPLSYVAIMTGGEVAPIEKVSKPLPETFVLGPVEPGQAFALDIEVDQSQVTVPVISALLTISSDAGVRREIPVVSIRRDLIDNN